MRRKGERKFNITLRPVLGDSTLMAFGPGSQIQIDATPADRDELEGHGASNIVHSLGIRVSNTSPYRADMKAIVERTFRSMNDLLIHKLPGAVRKPKERGERDPRLDAVLTLDEFRFLLIQSILQHNTRRLESYRLQPDMIADRVEPRPAKLWAWGIVNRNGNPRQTDPDIVRANLLPGAKATVTYHGIKFRGLLYSIERALREGWFVKSRATRSHQEDVVFDPRGVDVLFIRTTKGIEPCHLIEADQRFAGKPWEEIEDLELEQAEARDCSKTADLQSTVDHQAQVDAVVEKAVKEAAIANQGLTKAARLRGVRENRKEERLKRGLSLDVQNS